MRRDDLALAIEEAERFIKRGRVALAVPPDPEYPSTKAYVYGPEAAAVKRASMDLTKALPRLRRAR